MTDTEIIKALELEATPMERNCIYSIYIGKEACGIWCIKKQKIAENCMECKKHAMGYYGRYAKATLDLINRQKAEIERLKESRNRWMQLAEDFDRISREEEVDKAEAVKEFAEQLYKKAKRHNNSEYHYVLADDITDLAKETVGDAE